MARPSILITRRWPEAVEHQLAQSYNVELNRSDRPLTPAEFREAIKRYDAVLPTVTDKIGPEALDVSKPQTKILANYGVGYTHIDVDWQRPMELPSLTPLTFFQNVPPISQ